MIRRRFLNLVTEEYSTGVRSLHRLDVSKHLFYPSTAQAEAENAKEDNNGGSKPTKIRSLRRLPPPTMHLQPFPATDRPRSFDTFVLLSPHSSDGKILHTSADGLHSVVYDADTGSTTAMSMPSLQRPKGRGIPIFSISAAAAGAGTGEEGRESLYVMSIYHNYKYSFEILDYSNQQHPHKWETLPLPPLVLPFSGHGAFTTVDGGRTICLSSNGRDGTYCFDTRSRKWQKVGDWTLPFEGQAEYVPELDAWIGVRSYIHDQHQLCACSDLSAAMEAAAHRAPTSRHVWEYLSPPPIESEDILLRGLLRGHFLTRTRSWSTNSINLRNLGGGRFCIATVIRDRQTVSFNWEGVTATEEEFVVLSGVEVVRGSDNEEEGGLRMVKHKSKRYMFGSNKIQRVL